MYVPRLMHRFVLAAALLVGLGAAQAAENTLPDDAQLIASAMRAAPAHVARAATIVVLDANGKMRTLHIGSNGFTCMPDNPATPGPDPMCMDNAALAWVMAWMAHKLPPQCKLGLVYMLEGGMDPSNTDPFAAKPEKGGHWIKTGPHIMLVGAHDTFYADYPQHEDPDTGVPYVMWADTPYQHLMTPVQ